MTNTMIVTWNPEKWTGWSTFEEDVETTTQGKKVVLRWSTGNRVSGVEPNDRIFLLQQGQEQRGIIASGCALSIVFQAPHWDPEKQDQTINHVLVEFDTIVTASLDRQSLIENIPEGGEWRFQSSGSFLSSFVAVKLEDMWKQHVYALKSKRDEAAQPVDSDSTAFEIVSGIVAALPFEFTLQMVYHDQKILQANTNNRNIEAKIRQQLQVMRTVGFIEFIKADGSVAEEKFEGSGHYRKIGFRVPITESSDEHEVDIVRWGSIIARDLDDRQRALFLKGFVSVMSS